MIDDYRRRLERLASGMIEITGHVVGGEGVPDTIVRRLLECALDIFDCRGAYLIHAWGGEELIKYAVRRGVLRERPGLMEKRILSELRGFAAGAHRERELLAIEAPEGERGVSEECDLMPGVRPGALLIAPLRAGSDSMGVLGILGKGEDLLSEDSRHLVQSLADHAGVALRAAERHTEVEHWGFTDALTGVYNYRFLLHAVAREIERARRFDETFCLVMLDMDELKRYNDVHGHLRGSGVLKVAAGLAGRQLRAMDVLAKYGGDEFVVVLPQTTREGANLVAERIRRAIEEHPFPGEETSGRITSSLGIAVFPEDGGTVEDLIDRADQALYRAKKLGKNRVAAGAPKRPTRGRGSTGETRPGPTRGVEGS